MKTFVVLAQNQTTHKTVVAMVLPHVSRTQQEVFESLGRLLERVAGQLGDNFYMKNHETYGIDNVLFTIHESPLAQQNTEHCAEHVRTAVLKVET